MAVFIPDSEDQTRLDWKVLRDGGISIYRNHVFLDEDVVTLQTNQYSVRCLDCSTWLTSADMHDSLKHTLQFPDYYGRNLGALNDCLQENLDVPLVGGLVIIFRNFDRFANVSPESLQLASGILDICARSSRVHMLTGRRFLIFVQSDDPKIRFDGLGSVSGHWNRREWLSKNREL